MRHNTKRIFKKFPMPVVGKENKEKAPVQYSTRLENIIEEYRSAILDGEELSGVTFNTEYNRVTVIDERFEFWIEFIGDVEIAPAEVWGYKKEKWGRSNFRVICEISDLYYDRFCFPETQYLYELTLDPIILEAINTHS